MPQNLTATGGNYINAGNNAAGGGALSSPVYNSGIQGQPSGGMPGNGDSAIITPGHSNAIAQFSPTSGYGLLISSGQPNASQPAVGPGAPAGSQSNLQIPNLHQAFDTAEEASKGNKYPLPRTVVATVVSKSGTGANALTQVSLWNPDLFQPPTTNGSGSGSIVFQYQDGHNGVLVSEIITRARMGLGSVCYGVAQRVLIASGGAAASDPIGLGNLNGLWSTYTYKGNVFPDEFDEASDQGRGDFDDSIEVTPCVQNVARQVAFTFSIGGQNVAANPTYYNSVTSTFYFTRKYRM